MLAHQSMEHTVTNERSSVGRSMTVWMLGCVSQGIAAVTTDWLLVSCLLTARWLPILKTAVSEEGVQHSVECLLLNTGLGMQIALMFSDAVATISIPCTDFEEVPEITAEDEHGGNIWDACWLHVDCTLTAYWLQELQVGNFSMKADRKLLWLMGTLCLLIVDSTNCLLWSVMLAIAACCVCGLRVCSRCSISCMNTQSMCSLCTAVIQSSESQIMFAAAVPSLWSWWKR